MASNHGSVAAVEVIGLKRYFPNNVKAVDGVTFAIANREVHGFIGPNGAGKTTTMRIMATIDHPDEGDILVNGVSLVNYPDEIRPSIGFMPDYLDSYKDMNVDEYLDFYARAYRLAPAHRRRRLKDVIEFTGLGEFLDKPVDKLSKGMKQRLSLGRVLVNDPAVLVLDEPAAGLDPRARVELRTLIRMLADRGKAVFVSSHILTELAEVCDSVTIIEKGKVRASGTVSEIEMKVSSGTKVEVCLPTADDSEKKRLAMALAEMPGVLSSAETHHGVVFTYDGDASVRAGILLKLVQSGFCISDFHTATSGLEDAFLRLTERKPDA